MAIASLMLYRNSVDTINLLIIFIGIIKVLNLIIIALDSLNRFISTVAVKSLDCAFDVTPLRVLNFQFLLLPRFLLQFLELGKQPYIYKSLYYFLGILS